METKCAFYDCDKMCQVTGEKCDNPKDENCPSYIPSEVEEIEEVDNGEIREE